MTLKGLVNGIHEGLRIFTTACVHKIALLVNSVKVCLGHLKL